MSVSLSLVLPCFNEQENIEHTVREAFAWMGKAGVKGEVIVVDDGSKDASANVLDGLSKEFSALKVVRHAENQGYGLAIRSGCDAAMREWIAFVDSDGQFRIDDLGRLLPHFKSFSFVTGRRKPRADPLIRVLYGKVLALMSWLVFGIWIRDVNCGMKAFRRDIWPKIRPLYGVEKLFNTEVFLRLRDAKIPYMQVDVPHYRRRAGSPTGGSLRVIRRMFRELRDLQQAWANGGS
jgi:glycosyltransferase involved in cell wall biosynthesis